MMIMIMIRMNDEIQNIYLPISESGACDLMEEHFRKSLGADYSKLFKEKPEKVKREASEPKESLDNMDVDDAKAFKDDIDMSGYTGNILITFSFFQATF